jgi:hypothetical protein
MTNREGTSMMRAKDWVALGGQLRSDASQRKSPTRKRVSFVPVVADDRLSCQSQKSVGTTPERDTILAAAWASHFRLFSH